MGPIGFEYERFYCTSVLGAPTLIFLRTVVALFKHFLTVPVGFKETSGRLSELSDSILVSPYIVCTNYIRYNWNEW